jgi:hypothetical protein
MSFTFSDHGVCSCPSKGCGVRLGSLVSTTGSCTRKLCVGKSCVRKPLVAMHHIIGWELSCKHRVQACAHALLRRQFLGLLCPLWGNYPPGGKGHKVCWRCFAQSHVPTQACIIARYYNMRGQNLVEIAVMHHISHLRG